MLSLVPNRWAWIRSHPLDVAIVLLTPPFMPAAIQSLRVVRLLRLLRLLKAVQLSRQLFSPHGLRWASGISLVTIVAGGAAFAAVESPEQRLDSWDGIWWALTTVTTVGYGDYAPTTSTGRMIATLVMLIGIGLVALITAAAAERFIQGAADRDDDREEDLVLRRLDEISDRLDRLEESLDEGDRHAHHSGARR
jgi:voltage-gated potassium channel